MTPRRTKPEPDTTPTRVDHTSWCQANNTTDTDPETCPVCLAWLAGIAEGIRTYSTHVQKAVHERVNWMTRNQ